MSIVNCQLFPIALYSLKFKGLGIAQKKEKTKKKRLWHYHYGFYVFAFWQVIHPSIDPKVKKYHDAKYQIFRELYEQQLSHRSIMALALA